MSNLSVCGGGHLFSLNIIYIFLQTCNKMDTLTNSLDPDVDAA